MTHIPAIVVGGYLGAGKTTLINSFLRDPGGLRATVLVNDFGSINIDADLIENRHGNTIALTNGCACCTIGDDLIEAALQATMDTSTLDLLIVEASGVSHPDRIALSLMGVPALQRATTIAVINASTAQKCSQDKFIGRLFQDQVVRSDYLHINRKPEDRALSELISMPRNLDVLPPVLSDFSGALVPPETGNQILEQRGLADQRLAEFKTSVADFPEPLTEDSLNNYLSNLPESVCRAKGFVRTFDKRGKEYVAHVSHTESENEIEPALNVPDEHIGKIVLIAALKDGSSHPVT